MRLRRVTLDDGPLYEKLRCDPIMMSELGGPLPRESIPDKLARDVASAEAGRAWSYVILAGEADEPAGLVVIFDHEEFGEVTTEIGWMVLPAFQGRGLGRQAARVLLDRARTERRWEIVNALTAVTNGPSNAICRSLGFELVGPRDILFEGRPLHCNHWRIDLRR